MLENTAIYSGNSEKSPSNYTCSEYERIIWYKKL